MAALFTRLIVLLMLGALAAGCGSAPSNGGGRYSISQDRAPTRGIDPASIPEVIAGPVIRTGAGNRSPYTVLGRTYTVLPTERGYSARGVASWYGEKFHGHKTSNGEVFDMYKVSAAHTRLPIPSFLRVTNLENNRSIVVRVNDRGPFHGDRIIDLSYAAAVKLGFAERGTARVQLDAVIGNASRIPTDNGVPTLSAVASDPVSTTIGAAAENVASRAVDVEQMATALTRSSAEAQTARGLYLQIGAFSGLSAAEDVSRRVRNVTIHPVFIRSVETGNQGVLHRVRVGPFNDPKEARQLTLLLVAADLGSPYTVSE